MENLIIQRIWISNIFHVIAFEFSLTNHYTSETDKIGNVIANDVGIGAVGVNHQIAYMAADKFTIHRRK